jgi:hypothetical protein
MLAALVHVLALGVLSGPGNAEPPVLVLERIGRLEHPPIREASGLVASRRHRGVFWVHNDSGNPPALFAVRRDGTLLKAYRIRMPNVDWEDIAVDDDGHLYLGEIGNNGTLLPLRAVYRLDEPDPAQPGDDPLPVTRAWHYRFPPQGRFDAEGLFVDEDPSGAGRRAIVVAKTFDGREAELFSLPLGAAAPLARPVQVERLGVLPCFVEPVTGAGLSPDGLRLGVCSYDVARVYGRGRRGEAGWNLLGTVRFDGEEDGHDRGIEAVTWDGDDLILAGEGRGLYRIDARTWRTGTPPVP